MRDTVKGGGGGGLCPGVITDSTKLSRDIHPPPQKNHGTFTAGKSSITGHFQKSL